jgi:hypothetical protein
LHCQRVLFGGVVVLPARVFQDAEAEVRLGEVGRRARDPLELRHRPFHVAELIQRRAEPMAQRRVVGSDLEALAEVVRSHGPVARVERAAAPYVVGFGAFEQRVEPRHQRILGPRLDVALLFELRFCARQIADAAIRHAERIVDGGCLRLKRCRLLEMLDRVAVVPCGKGSAPGAVARGGGVGFDRQRFGEERGCRVGLSLLQIRIAERHQRREIVRRDLEHPLERGNRVLERALHLVELPEVIRPPLVVGRQRLRVQETRAGRVEVGRRHQQRTHLAVCRRERCAVRGALGQGVLQGGEACLHLLADRRLHRREVRERDRLQPESGRGLERYR